MPKTTSHALLYASATLCTHLRLDSSLCGQAYRPHEWRLLCHNAHPLFQLIRHLCMTSPQYYCLSKLPTGNYRIVASIHQNTMYVTPLTQDTHPVEEVSVCQIPRSTNHVSPKSFVCLVVESVDATAAALSSFVPQRAGRSSLKCHFILCIESLDHPPG